jgi:tetratricopeptide (TPR) repeat protein
MQYAERSGRSFFLMFPFAVDQVAQAQAAVEAGRWAEARVLLEAQPASGMAAALLARVYGQLRMPERAAVAARRAEQLAAGEATVQHTLALYYAAAGKRGLAAEWEGRYARSPQADGAAALRAAMLFGEVGEHEKAIAFGVEALGRGERPELRLLLARAYEATGKPEEAVGQYRALLTLLPYDEPTHAGFGQALLRMARFNEAASFLAEARGKFDKSPQIELAYGVALYTQRRFAEAGAAFFRVIALAPTVPQPYIFLSRMIDQVPERAEALRELSAAWLRNEPVNGFAPFVYARALQATGAPDSETKPLLLEAMRRDGKVWEFPYELGQLLERRREWAGAAAAYEKAIALNATVPEPHYRLARVYDRLEKPALAARERAVHQKLQSAPKGGMQ